MMQIHSWQNKKLIVLWKMSMFQCKGEYILLYFGDLLENSGVDELIINMTFHYLTNKEDSVASNDINRTHKLDS